MLDLPSKTQVDKKIPKQRFYENMVISPSAKRVFVEQIRHITWLHKIAPSTVNVAVGLIVTEIEIFKIDISKKDFDISILRQIDNAIPYHNIYLLSYENDVQAWIRFRSEKGTFVKYYNSKWIPKNEFTLLIKGLDIDVVYESMVEQISGIKREKDLSLTESLQKEERIRRTKKEIEQLEGQARNEKQPKKKFELVQKINILREALK